MTLPPRLIPLLKQFDDARDRLIARLQGLTDYTTGSRSLVWDDFEIHSRALTAIASLATASETWRTVLAGTTDVQLDQVGRSQLPWGLDPELPLPRHRLVGESRTSGSWCGDRTFARPLSCSTSLNFKEERYYFC